MEQNEYIQNIAKVMSFQPSEMEELKQSATPMNSLITSTTNEQNVSISKMYHVRRSDSLSMLTSQPDDIEKANEDSRESGLISIEDEEQAMLATAVGMDMDGKNGREVRD
eukprot:124481_1